MHGKTFSLAFFSKKEKRERERERERENRHCVRILKQTQLGRCMHVPERGSAREREREAEKERERESQLHELAIAVVTKLALELEPLPYTTSPNRLEVTCRGS